MKITTAISFIFFTLIINLNLASAQKSKFTDSSKKFKTWYADQLSEGEKIKKSWYHYVTTEKEGSDGKEYYARVFYPETAQIISLEQYKSKKHKIKHGYAMYWTEQGMLASEGNFKNDKRVGIWKYYDRKEGTLNSVGSYRNDERTGIWTNFHNGISTSMYKYKNGKREGEFIIYDTLGIIENKGIYKNDTIYSQEVTPIINDTVSIEQMPMFYSEQCQKVAIDTERKKCAENEMLQYIYKNLKYPATARQFGVQGRVIVQFVVNKTGGIEDIYFLRSLCQSIKEECTQLIENMPKWTPGTKDGKAVKVMYTLPILFKFDQ